MCVMRKKRIKREKKIENKEKKMRVRRVVMRS